MTAPVRIQLSRKRGWRMPENTVKVDRSTPWGNPYQGDGKDAPDRAYLAELFREYLSRPEQAELRQRVQQKLRGKNLACWCPPGPCHADVLLEVANR